MKIARPTLWICTPEVLTRLEKISAEEPIRAILVMDAAAQSPSSFKTIPKSEFEIRTWTSATITNSGQQEGEFAEPFLDVQQDLVALPFSSG